MSARRTSSSWGGGGDNVTAKLSNLTNANLGATDAISGGAGTDALTLDNVKLDGVSRLQNWESIDATNDTELTLDGNLVLGDSGTGTGSLSVDVASTLSMAVVSTQRSRPLRQASWRRSPMPDAST